MKDSTAVADPEVLAGREDSTVAAAAFARGLSKISARGLALPRLDGAGLALTIFSTVFFALGLLHFTDPDYWWHLRTGQLIVDSGSIPRTDPFSYTVAGKDWVAHEWLSEVIIYGLQSIGGYALNAIVFVLVAIAACLVGYKAAITAGVSRGIGVLLFVWAASVAYGYWTVRPQVFTWLLFAVFLALIVEHRNGRNRLWLLPPLMVLWANLHLGYFYGIAMVGLYVVALILERFILKQPRDLKWPVIALAGCFLASLITPNPIEQVYYPLRYLSPGSSDLSFIAEWQSPNFHGLPKMPLAFTLLVLLGLGVRGRKEDLFLPGMALAFSYLVLFANRHQPLFAIVFLVVVASILASRYTWARPGGINLRRQAKQRPLANAVLALCAMVACAVIVPQLPPQQLHAEANIERRLRYPQEGAAYIARNHPEARIFNVYHWGGYLINELYPQKVFIDGRAEMYGAEMILDYRTVNGVWPGWQDVLEKHDIDVALVQKGSQIADRLSVTPGWQIAHEGEIEAVYVRRSIGGP